MCVCVWGGGGGICVMTWHLCVIVKVVCAAVLDSGDGSCEYEWG